jgi:CRISPR-associated protein Csd2
VAHGFVSAHLAAQTGFSEEDLQLFWEALVNMFDHDRSAARGEMSTRGLHIFKHASGLGNAPAHSLLRRIKPNLNEGVLAPRDWEDYLVTVDRDGLPNGVELTSLVL